MCEACFNCSTALPALPKALNTGKYQDEKDCSQSRIRTRVSTSHISETEKDAVQDVHLSMTSSEELDIFECNEGEIDPLPDKLQDSLNNNCNHRPYLQQQPGRPRPIEQNDQSSYHAPAASSWDEEMLSCFLSRQSCKVCILFSMSNAKFNGEILRFVIACRSARRFLQTTRRGSRPSLTRPR